MNAIPLGLTLRLLAFKAQLAQPFPVDRAFRRRARRLLVKLRAETVAERRASWLGPIISRSARGA